MPEHSPAQALPCTVMLNESIAPDVWRMRLHCPALAQEIVPGQFFNLYVPGDPTQLLRLPFSWAMADPQRGEVEFAYGVVGDGTRRLSGLPVGTVCNLLGPAGHGWSIPEGAKRGLLVAGGSGIVSLVPLAKALGEAGIACDMVIGVSTAARVCYEPELEGYGARLFVATEDGTRGTSGTAADVTAPMIENEAYDVVYTCGPEAMMGVVAAQAKAAGVPCQVSMERLMACGFGACTTCLVDTVNGRKGACMAGPVFDAEEVLW